MLILIRHGKAIDADTWRGLDRDRPLSDEGRQRTLSLAHGARFLVSQLKNPRLFSSPYQRAYETARLLAEVWQCDVETSDLFQPGWDITHLPPHYDTEDMIIVGHMPDLSHVLAALTGGKTLLEFSPPSLAALTFDKATPRCLAYLSWQCFTSA